MSSSEDVPTNLGQFTGSILCRVARAAGRNRYTLKYDRRACGIVLDKWEQHLEKYLSFLMDLSESRENNLKFGRSVVAASDVAAQFFCEKKVEMQYLYGEIETQAKMVGMEAHETLVDDAVRVKREELWQKIYGKDPVLARETLFFAKHKDIVVAGKPDAILFRNGLPLVVFEHKFSKNLVAYQAHHVQARTYGLLLNNMGFDTKYLFYAIVVADPIAKYDGSLKKKVINAITRNRPKEGILELDNARVFLCKYNQIDAEKDLNWAVKFWKQEREAIPTRNLNKCKKCEYFKKCQS